MTTQVVAGDVVDVWFDGHLVGHVERRSEVLTDIAFRYVPSWSESAGSFPISLAIPLDQLEHSPATTYPWFMNLLPEGRALQMVGSALKVSEIDVFAMLAEMGGDLPGALEIRQHDAAPRAVNPHYHRLTENELAACIRRLPERPLLVGEVGIAMSAAGAQEKLPVVRYRDGTLGLPLDGAPSTHILKPRNKKLHDSVPNEAYCLKLARAAKLQAVPVEIGRAEDIDYILVRRYDRTIEGRTVRRIHQEDLCQATGYPPFLKYEWNREVGRHGPQIKDCMDLLGHTQGQALNKMRFFESMLFNVLVGNVDAHSKNYSLVIRGISDITMAPLYDVMNGDIYPDVTQNLAMKIAGKQRGRHIHGRHWERFSVQNGLSPTQVKHRVADVSRAVLASAPDVAETMDRELGNVGICYEISGYVVDYCRRMLANLDTEPASEPNEDNGADQEPESDDIVISP
jgi:serine/threonine-protein kinase HipA